MANFVSFTRKSCVKFVQKHHGYIECLILKTANFASSSLTCSLGSELECLRLVVSVVVLARDPGNVSGLWDEALEDVLADKAGLLCVNRSHSHFSPTLGVAPGICHAVSAFPAVTHLEIVVMKL